MALRDNFIQTTNENVYLYTSKIWAAVDDYIQDNIPPDADIYKSLNFPDMLFYIHDCIGDVDKNNISAIKGLWDIYIRLCVKYKYTPAMYHFELISGISDTLIGRWCSRNTKSLSSEYAEFAQSAFATCRRFYAADLQNRNGGDVNRIFAAKAVYGYAETQPVTVAEAVESSNNAAIGAAFGLGLPGDDPAEKRPES